MAIKLYSWPHSSGTRVAWALEELGLAYDYVTLDAKKLEQRSPGYLAVNPHGKVPALIDEGQALFESGAILLHLGRKYGVEKRLWPAPDSELGAQALCWTVWGMADLGPYLMQYLYHGLDTPISYKPEDRSKACAAYNHSQLTRGLEALEARLNGREHLLGAFSLADIAPASWLLLGASLGLKVSAQRRVAAWLERCAGRPAYKRAR
jgi:glutathione S-transferase